jgi:hypothetical protein
VATKTGAALRFTLSGPGIDKSYETAGVALSAGITAAERYGAEASFYVRDVDGTMVGRVERDEDGRVTIERAKFIGAGR